MVLPVRTVNMVDVSLLVVVIFCAVVLGLSVLLIVVVGLTVTTDAE